MSASSAPADPGSKSVPIVLILLTLVMSCAAWAEARSIVSNSQRHEVVLANDESLKIVGNQNLLIITGQGIKVSVIGNQNGVTVDGKLKHVALLGDQNQLIVIHHEGTDKPTVTQTGSNNDIIVKEVK
jgi:hypothetical protein